MYLMLFTNTTLFQTQEWEVQFLVCSNSLWYYLYILELSIHFYKSSSIHYDQLNHKAPQAEIHRCQVGWLGWPMHITNDLTLSAKQEGTPSCWKQAVSTTRAVLSCTAGIKNSRNSLRYELKLKHSMLVFLSKSACCSNYQNSYSTHSLVYSLEPPHSSALQKILSPTQKMHNSHPNSATGYHKWHFS